jgi:site-specific DNA recombinase
MRIAVYTRISTDEDHQPYSLEAQSGRLKSYIDSQDGWNLVRSFSDQASGAKTERSGLQQALREARAGRFDLLLVYRVDRFSRSVRGLAQLLEELDACGVAFRSATEPFDTTTAAGRMMVQMLAVFAEFERATIIDRVIAGMERKAARGEWTSGNKPYGYEVDKATSQLIINDVEAPLVPVIFDLYANKELGARAIAAWLNDKGHRSKRGCRWTYTSVLTVLRNRAYVGEIYFRGTYHPASHVPLVETDLFDAAAKLLNDRGEDYAKRVSSGSEYLLSGLVVCDQCNKRFVGCSARGNRYRYMYYTCHSRQKYGKDECGSERIPANQLDDAVLASLIATYREHNLFDRAVAAIRDSAGATRAQHQLQQDVVAAEISKAEEAIERYLLAFENGTLNKTACGERLKALSSKLSDLRVTRGQLAEAIDATDLAGPSEADLTHWRSQVEEAISSGSTKDQKRLLGALVQEVRIFGREKIIPTFKIPYPDEQHEKVRTLSGLVETMGLEPTTLCLQSRCATNCATSPSRTYVSKPFTTR